MNYKRGHISETKPGFARVFLPGEDGIVTDWLAVCFPFTMGDKAIWTLPLQAQVACLMDEYLDEGVIIGCTYNDEDAPPEVDENMFKIIFEDGTELSYDKSAHELKATVSGKVTVNATGPIDAATTGALKAKAGTTATVEAPIIQLNGNVTVSGTLAAGAVTINGTGTITGDISVTGKITSTNDIVSSGGEIIAGGKNLSSHTHSGVQTGGGTSGPPV